MTYMKQTQLEWIKNELATHGEISRNTALRHFCSRLGARILDLKQEGYTFDIERRDGDYVYKIPKEVEQKTLI